MKSQKIDLIVDTKLMGDKYMIFINDALKIDLFEEDFWIKINGQKLTQVPETVLLIPFYLNVAPVIWVSGLTVTVDCMDTALFYSLIRLKKVLRSMYPTVEWNGEINVNRLVAIDFLAEKNNSILLFSGGLDSVATSYRHHDEKQTLVTVRGSDIALDDDLGWHNVQNATEDYAQHINADCFFIESNFYDFLNHAYLGNISKAIPLWWAYVQHGMGLSGLMAIPSWFKGASNVYIASSHSYEFSDSPWGSVPKIDNEIAWFGLNVQHDCFDLTRQGKINLITDRVRRGSSAPYLRVCYSSRGGKNCCVCEKCSRTMSGLLVSGFDYNNFGFDLLINEFATHVDQAFKGNKFIFSKSTVFMWTDIQCHIKSKDFYLTEGLSLAAINYLDWLKRFDFVAYESRQAKQAKIRGKIIEQIKVVPGLYAFLKFIKRKVK